MARTDEVISIGDVTVELSSQGKLMFPDDGITKGGLISYYLEVASTMLPYLEGRPITVERFTSGIGKPGFVQKEAGEHYPEWIPRVAVARHSVEGETTHYPLVEDAAALIWLVNQNAIEFHVVAVRTDRLTQPDLLVMDLDPSDDDFEKVRRGARELADLFSGIGLAPFVKTTGSRGLHVVAPIVPEEETEVVLGFARTLADRLCRRLPGMFTTEVAKNRRGDRVFVDYLRNGRMQTVVAPYSVRGLPGAPVSTPLSWAELDDPALDARRFNLRNVGERLGAVGDPWSGMQREARSLAAARELLGA